jgi:hypothetical protein
MLEIREIHTQKDNVLKHLKSGREINSLDALEQYGCFRLAAVIWNLRDEGHKIITSPVISKYGKSFASYKLKDDLVPSQK